MASTLLTAVLIVPSTARAQPELACGQPISGALAVEATQSYRFTPPAGTAVVVQGSTLSPDELPLLRLRARGTGVDEDTCSNVLDFIAGGGPVVIDVSACIGGSGSYTLNLQVVSAGSANCALPLACGLTPLGTELAVPGEVDAFRFPAVAGEQVRLVFSDEAGRESAYRLRLYDRSGAAVVAGSCADTTNVSIPSTGEYTALVSSCTGLRTSGYGIERFDASCPLGPQITFMGLLPQDQSIVIATSYDAQGRPIYFGERGVLVIEARSGETGATVGANAYTPGSLPDLQMIVDRPLGDGSQMVCDVHPPGGVPASRPFVLGQDSGTINRVNDLGCRVDDGTGRPVGHRSSIDACPRGPSGSATFVASDTTVEFCLPISTALAFPAGDTIVKARVRGQDRALGAEREIVVRVATAPATATPTPSPTRTFTRTPTATMRSPTPTPTPTVPVTRPPGPCTGDCNENGQVTVAELTRSVRIALGSLAIPACRLADGNEDAVVDIADLITAANNALYGCPPSPGD